MNSESNNDAPAGCMKLRIRQQLHRDEMEYNAAVNAYHEAERESRSSFHEHNQASYWKGRRDALRMFLPNAERIQGSALQSNQQETGEGCLGSACSESSAINEILAGNALFFLLNLRQLYDFVNGSTAPREVRECLKRINLAAASIQGALGNEGYARAKARDEKMNADLEAFFSQNVNVDTSPPQ
jgi:hypothetical protein